MRQLLGYKIVTEAWNHSLEEQLLELSREGYELWGGPLEEHYWPPDKDSSLSYRVSQAMVKWGPETPAPRPEVPREISFLDGLLGGVPPGQGGG